MPPTRIGVVVAALCGLAFLRVLFLAAAFPPFNNVDEVFHYDLVVKAASGEFPVRLTDTRLSVATRDAVAVYGTGVTMPQPGLIVLHASPEYMSFRPPDGVAPPVWQAPALLQRAAVDHGRRQWDLTNYLAVDPPLYYAVAGGWQRAGRAFGMAGGHLFYWTRTLDALVAVLLVWLTWRLAREFFPEGSLVRFGAPLLVAFFPQDTAHAVSSDVLAPLAVGLACYAALRFAVAETPSVLRGGATGLAVAAALLTKGSTEAVLAVAALGAVARWRAGRPWLGATLAMAAAAVVPIALWMLRFTVAGVPGAAAQKLASFGWTTKRVGELLDHPVFTLAGAATYVEHGVATFWRGELIWHKAILIAPPLETFYVMSSVLLVGVAAVRLFVGPDRTRLAVAACLVGFVGSVAWIVVLSIAFHFPDRIQQYPIPEWPYLSGRLLIAALVPFAVVYVAGLEALLGRLRILRWGRAVVVALVAGVTIGESILMRPALGSAYNWFALLSASASPPPL